MSRKKCIYICSIFLMAFVLMGCSNKKSAKGNVIENINAEKEKTLSNDLVYREYKIGFSLPASKVTIHTQAVREKYPKGTKIVVFFNDEEYKTFSITEDEKVLNLKQGGYYGFYVVDENKQWTDISLYVSRETKTEKSELLPVL